MARLEQDEQAARVITLTRCFCEVVRARCVTHGARPTRSCKPFEAWLEEACHCGVRAVETFAEGLRQDGAAIQAALTTQGKTQEMGAA